jgi:hypothetical protein
VHEETSAVNRMAAYFQSWILLISVASGMYCVGESSDIPFMTFPPVGTLCPSVVPLKHATVQIISNRAASTRRQRELDNITRPAAPPQNVLRTRPKRKARKDSPPTNDLQDTLTVGISMEYVILFHLRYHTTHTHTRERERESARPRRIVPSSRQTSFPPLRFVSVHSRPTRTWTGYSILLNDSFPWTWCGMVWGTTPSY